MWDRLLKKDRGVLLENAPKEMALRIACSNNERYRFRELVAAPTNDHAVCFERGENDHLLGKRVVDRLRRLNELLTLRIGVRGRRCAKSVPVALANLCSRMSASTVYYPKALVGNWFMHQRVKLSGWVRGTVYELKLAWASVLCTNGQKLKSLHEWFSFQRPRVWSVLGLFSETPSISNWVSFQSL